ncbi:MAG TPA: YifB family Mg chelatase-like AAA ATPase [Vicinamibacterales bacterium]|jgi:magnesium chelatase family protein
MRRVMLARLRSAALIGIEACPVFVEVDVSFGIPSFAMVGLPDASVRESRDRVRSAIRNSGFDFPPHRITVNLAPADVRKAGASFDLPIALGILAASGVVERRHVADLVLLGELSLDGSIHPARGVLPIAVAARRESLAGLLLPLSNATEAAIVEGLAILPVASLVEAVAALNNPAAATVAVQPSASACEVSTLDLADVRGQLLARRAIEIAAAGGHNLLLVGPPGSGKTMLARRMAGVLPPMTFDESIETTAIHSVAGLLRPGAGLLLERPFRAPHHTISNAALVGGGSPPRPGEVSLAHHGVLFLDEMLEFNRPVLEALRQPVEEGSVTIARAAGSAVFPARFTLVAAMNPCPCGFFGDGSRTCRCTPLQLERYRERLSGPLRDRLDMTVDVPAVPADALQDIASGEPSSRVRARVCAARQRQLARYDALAIRTNAELSPGLLARFCVVDGEARRMLSAATRRMALSARGYDRIRKVARTIADLADVDMVGADHIAEAVQFRMISAPVPAT